MKVMKIASRRGNEPLRVAAYCRVSTLKDSQEESYETQVQYYTALIAANPAWTLVDIFADQGFTGTSIKNRQAFNALIELARQGGVDLILVKSISRFSRNIVDCHKVLTELTARNVEVRFEKEAISSFDSTADFIFSLLSIVAQDESRSISENVKWSYRTRFERGQYCIGSNQILGYDKDPSTRKLVPNQDAWIIRLIFQRFAEGASYHGIARELNRLGARRLRSKADWTPALIFQMLRNETYVGDKLLQKSAPCDYLTKRPDLTIEYDSFYLENDHEPIVDRTTWDTVQGMLSQRQAEKETGIHYQHTTHHAFYGKLFCGECGQVYKRRTFCPGKSERVQRTHVWNCKGRQKGKEGNGCQNMILSEKALEEMIAHSLEWSFFSTERFCKEVTRVEVTSYGVVVFRKAA